MTFAELASRFSLSGARVLYELAGSGLGARLVA